MEKEEIGKIVKFFPRPSAAVVELTAGLKMGDRICIKGVTTDFEQEVTSMQIEGEPITEAKPGEVIGVEVKERVRPNDVVYKVVE